MEDDTSENPDEPDTNLNTVNSNDNRKHVEIAMRYTATKSQLTNLHQVYSRCHVENAKPAGLG